MNITISIIVVIIMLGVLATLHELGHFIAARLLKIKVYEVSIFVGPKLVKWKHKDVDFSIRLIPIGAYVRFNEVDEEGYLVDSKDPDLLANQPRWKRLLVALAGPFMNFVLGTLIFLGIFCFTGYTSTEIGTPYKDSQLEVVSSEYTPGDKIIKVNGARVYSVYDLSYEIDCADITKDMTLTLKSKETGKLYDITLTPEFGVRPMLLITTIRSDDPVLSKKGWLVYQVDPEQNNNNPVLKEGDYVTSIQGKSVLDEDFNDFILGVTDDVLTVTYIRDGEEQSVEIIPKYVDYVSERGVSFYGYRVNTAGHFFSALGYAAKMPASMWNITVRGIREIIEGKVKAYNLVSGPIGITTMVNDVVADEHDTTGDKVYMLVMLSAVISIALAFSNLLPIPGLDGVQIVLIVVEMVIGRKLSEKAENRLTIIGFVLIIMLVIFALVSDILRIMFGY